MKGSILNGEDSTTCGHPSTWRLHMFQSAIACLRSLRGSFESVSASSAAWSPDSVFRLT